MNKLLVILVSSLFSEFSSATLEIPRALTGDHHGDLDLVRMAGKRAYSSYQWRRESDLGGAHKKFKKTKSYRETQENTVRMLIKLCEEVVDEDQDNTENEVLKNNAVDKVRPFPQFSTAPLYFFKYKRFGSLLDQQERARRLRNKLESKVRTFSLIFRC